MNINFAKIFNFIIVLIILLNPLILDVNPVAAASTSPKDVSIQVEHTLLQEFETKGNAGYLIYFHSDVDLSPAYKMTWQERGQFVMETLQREAQKKQARVQSYLDAQGVRYQSFWIDNIIVVDSSSKQVFDQLLSFPEIQSIKARRTLYLIEPVSRSVSQENQIFAVEPNLARVNADDVWALGITGAGYTVANIDTGVRYTHQALKSQYRGNLGGGNYDHNYNWYDPYGTYSYPYDGNGHGTHTMGTMVGSDGGANQIGIAPGAKWIACRGCSTSSCSDSALLACAQFIAAPTKLDGSSPDPSKRPIAVNNSWGDCGTSYDDWYQGVVDAWLAAGIYPVFANGNASNCGYSSPPGLNTVGNPARYGNVTGVGSTGQSNGQYATHSNWGPTDNPDTVNPNPNNAFGAVLKPQVVAPGVNIRSSVASSDTAYASYTGTSMSAPHVTGLVALITQAAPCLAGDYATIENIIENTAVRIPYATGGTPAPPAGNSINYATGHGEIDALAAVNLALGLCGSSTLSGQVVDSSTSNPISGVRVEINTNPARFTFTDANGNYSFNLSDGTYDLTFSKYGYITKTITNVTVTGSATVDTALDPAPVSTVSGVVTDALTGWPLYARIQITGVPVGPVFTNPVTGAYSFDVVDGSYTLTVTAMSGGYLASNIPVVVSGNTVQNIALNPDTSLTACNAPGYRIVPGTVIFTDGFDTSTAPNFSPDWNKVDVSGTAGDWQTRTSTRFPPGGLPRSAPNLAFFNSYTASSGSSTRLYRTSGVNLSAVSSAEVSFWMYHDTGYPTYNDRIQVQVSTDGGSNWVNVGSPIPRYDGTTGWAKHTVNLNAYTGPGMTDVRVAFLGISGYGNDIHIDDVTVSTATTCQPIPDAGLVIGSVFDANTNLLVQNATVQDASSNSAQFIDASADPATPDRLYVIAQPAGAVALTASAPGYGSDVRTVNVVAGGTVGQDFYLPAAALSYTPTSLSATLGPGDVQSQTLTISNNGTLPLTFDLQERNGGFTPLSVVPPRQILQPASSHAFDARQAPEQPGRSTAIYEAGPNAILIDEGFEGGVVPPSGWLEVVNNSNYNWQITTTTAYAGSYAATVLYDPALVPQNEWLLSPEINLAGGTLSFWSLGSLYWCRDVYDNCDLNVWLVVGAVGGGDDVFVGKADPSWPASFTWAQSVFNLDGLVPGGPVRIGFQYIGVDGAQIALDAITLDGIEGSLDIPWLTLTPMSGTIPEGESQAITATFDATGLTNLGTYTGTLRITTNDPLRPVVNVPVTLNLVDNVPPTTVSIVRADANPTNAASVNFTVTFSEPVSGVDVADFALFTTGGISGASVTGVTQVSASEYTVTVNTGAGSGTLRLDVPTTATITDTAGNPLSGLPYTDGEAYDIDKDAPTVTSIVRADANPTNAASVNFTVTFSEAVSGVDVADFALFTTGGISGASVTGVTQVSASEYTVTVDTGSGNGTIRLDVPDSATITDLVGNPLAGLPYTDGEAYDVIKSDKLSPANGATNQSTTITLSWRSIPGATEYQYCYSSAPSCTQWHSVGANTSVTLRVAPNFTYHWQVRAIVNGTPVELDGGNWWSFTTHNIPPCTWPTFTPPASPTFADVPTTHSYWTWIERLSNSGITGGCGGGNFCPNNAVTRAQMAVFLLRGRHCGNYTPPAITSSPFADVPSTSFYAPWIAQLASEGITGGCGGGNFCPNSAVTRAQMAIFLLRSRHGPTFSPPAITSSPFADVPSTSFYAPWIAQLANEGITGGCGGGNFCPNSSVTRAQMAVFLIRSFVAPFDTP